MSLQHRFGFLGGGGNTGGRRRRREEDESSIDPKHAPFFSHPNYVIRSETTPTTNIYSVLNIHPLSRSIYTRTPQQTVVVVCPMITLLTV